MVTSVEQDYQLVRHDSHYAVVFRAMASPCELLIETADEMIARAIAKKAVAEVRRIECKYSRYLSDNICFAINNANGNSVNIDDETYRLLAFGETCFELSDGMFDLTSGVLREAWRFDCSDRIPTQRQIDALLPLVGWSHVSFSEKHIQMPAGMEVDFGGIGKEYAVSSVSDICRESYPAISILINLGGDIQITVPRENQLPWLVGIENHNDVIPITQGALATSGDANRYLLKNGRRYSHILNPKTGWPIPKAPSSVTTHAPLCIQAGCLATLALLNGKNAERFLKSQDVIYWCSRS